MKAKSIAAALLMASVVMPWSGAFAKDPRPGLFIRTGEAYIFRIENGQPSQVRRATAGEAPAEGEVRAEMSARGGTILTMTNRTGGALNYEAYIARDEFQKGSRTSVCTILAGPIAMEHWPDEVPGIRVTNFEPGGDGLICR